tara:strand:- start:3866 stop:4420 length:555 start_codon:yes stop_codon:yes gene_type:complete
MKKIFFFLIFVSTFNPLHADLKDQIILNLKKTNNLSFNFIQTINDKDEKGNCIIEYQKKIFCSYDNYLKKIIVSNGKALVIKNQTNNQYYFYPLSKTPLDLILDKNFLINQIQNMEGRMINDKYYNFSLKKNNNKINIFFDKKNSNLIGWQTEDIFQNLAITFISDVKINQKISKKIFDLPKIN